MKGWIVILGAFLSGLWFFSCADSGRIDFETDRDIDIGEDDRTLYAEKPTGATNRDMHLSFRVDGFNLGCVFRAVEFLDADNRLLQRNSGAVVIDTWAKRTEVIVEEAPLEFQRVDFWLDEAVVGGGDVGGHGVNLGGGDVGGYGANYHTGGGDVGGIVLPHLIVDRLGGSWANVVVRFKVESFSVPETAAERRLFVEKMVRSLAVEENGETVGSGDADATTLRLAYWPATYSGQEECFDDWTALSHCAGEAGSDACAETEYCGQDAQYRGERDWETLSIYELFDPVTGLIWMRELSSCDQVVGCTAIEAKDYCAAAGWRTPSFLEARTVVNFGAVNKALDEQFISPRALQFFWTSTRGGEGNSQIVIDAHTGIPSSLVVEQFANTLCVKGPELAIAEPLLQGGVDTLSGLMWSDDLGAVVWKEALSLCEGSTASGFSDWRLPNIAELSLLLFRQGMTPDSGLWSSTTYAGDPEMAWAIQPSQWNTVSKQEKVDVVCVRDIP
ncbi:MAG: DUF1566 domain-containing protein [Myxococcales bacterium]|nr:MAG: DUF1566 domain-containing protein [Myxococcales bacterium]